MTPPYTDFTVIPRINAALELAGLEWFGFRLPGLRVECHFHWKCVESESFAVGVHGHEHWEISRPVRGAAHYAVLDDERTIDVVPELASFFVVPPRISHSWELTRAPLLLNSWQVRFEPEDEGGVRLLSCLRRIVRESGFRLKATPFQEEAEDLLWRLALENLSPGLFGPMASGLARVVLGGIFSHVQPWPIELHERDLQQNPAKSLANKIREFLESNVQNPVTMSDLESHFHYSSRQMNRIFQDHYHVTISQYLRDRRFDLAARWLATTDRAIKDIALSLGFGSVSHFCRYFRRLKRLSPTEYRDLATKTEGKYSFVENPRTLQ